jgi:hypothetical protein
MSVTRTFTVTVVSTGSGNKYFIDGVQQATVNLAEGATYRFDQSDSSNSNHPLRFSTTSGGTHSGGDEYTTGVTTNGTPGSDGAYTQITVASSAPTLYYYCSNHPAMGGQANTPTSNTWGVLTWGANAWQSNEITQSLTSPGAITSAVGDVTAFPLQGWGSDSWGDEGWGESSFSFELTAPDAVTLNVSVGSTYGDGSWGQEQGWGQFVINPADVMGLTGVSSTSSVGSVTMIGSAEFSISGVSATSSVGSIAPADVMGLTGIASTSAVGALTPADVVGISGVSATASSGSITINSSPVVVPTGQSATASVGSIDPLAIVQGLTGQAITSAVGSTTVDQIALGLTGQSATVSVAAFGTASGFGIQAYSDVDTGSNSSYTNVATGSNTSYTDAA